VAFNITRLTTATPVHNRMYFLDANVWIYALQYIITPSSNHWEQVYVDFFEDLINDTIQPKILMPSVLFSEIVNTYIRQVALEDFKNTSGILNPNFKRDFRPTPEYLNAYHSILDDLNSYKSCIQFIDDSNILSPLPHFLSRAFTNIDFNDKYYYHLLKELSKNTAITIVTNDGDFHIEDIPILTVNRDLLAL
jgi:hypothetical protein